MKKVCVGCGKPPRDSDGNEITDFDEETDKEYESFLKMRLTAKIKIVQRGHNAK